MHIYYIEVYKNGKWAKIDTGETFDKQATMKVAKNLENQGHRVRVLKR